MKVLLCVVLVAFVAVKAQQEYPLPEYYDINYDTYDDALDDINENTDVKQSDSIESTQILDVPEQIDTQKESDKDQFADYQIEDNRSQSTEKEQVEENKEEIPEEAIPSETSVSEEAEQHKVLPLEFPGESNEEFEELGDDVMDAVFDDDVAPLPVPEAESDNNGNIFEETKDILNQGKDYLDELDQSSPVDDVNPVDDKDMDQIIEETNKLLADNDDTFDEKDDGTSSAQQQSDEGKDMDQIIEETNKLLADNDDTFDEKDDDTSSTQQQNDEDKDLDQIIEETSKLLADNDETFDGKDGISSAQQQSDEDAEDFEEDTPAKVYADLNADLDKLFETFDKLGMDESEENEESNNEAADNQNVEDYEEKNGKPYNEDIALSWRNADVDAAEPEKSKNEEAVDENDDEVADENVVLNEEEDNLDDDYEVIDDSNLSQIFAAIANVTNENEAKETTASVNNIDENKEAIDDVVGFDNYDERSDSEPNADDDIDSVIKQIFAEDVKEPEEAQPYGNDALVDEKLPKEVDAVEFEGVETTTTDTEEEVTPKAVMVDDLNSAQLDDLMAQFVEANKESFDVNSENFAKHEKINHVLLKIDEPTVITSPDYPEPYPPGSSIIDWVLEGPGSGIELNITDLDLNGALDDYLLIKPGGLDAEGTDGLIFTYHLNSERRYRFTDVDRVFIRFRSNSQIRFNRGFSLSVRLIGPPRSYPEDEPEAEPVASPPKETLTLNLAGLTLVKFLEIKGQFLELLADMAKEYIKDRKIDIGLNTTHEVTQITRTAVCNIQWPEYETCVEVVFGVPLHYEEEQAPRLTTQELDEMWTGYIVQEQFSERLRSLGITEYAIPNDRTVLMVWLVIAAGVIISMAMLAFALWRFSCFEDYTRMQAYGDTDSIQNEKRHLGMYPTPHQPLPPLYSENDYKWADEKYDDSTRVDMGGFANRSYVRDDLYDLDSDEDVIPPRDSKGAFSPRDYFDA